jgi:hypothetical protein
VQCTRWTTDTYWSNKLIPCCYETPVHHYDQDRLPATWPQPRGDPLQRWRAISKGFIKEINSYMYSNVKHRCTYFKYFLLLCIRICLHINYCSINVLPGTYLNTQLYAHGHTRSLVFRSTCTASKNVCDSSCNICPICYIKYKMRSYDGGRFSVKW